MSQHNGDLVIKFRVNPSNEEERIIQFHFNGKFQGTIIMDAEDFMEFKRHIINFKEVDLRKVSEAYGDLPAAEKIPDKQS